MIFTNKHIVLILIIIIIFVFIYNYDVYVVPKNEPLCKPVFVTKRELSPEERAEFNKSETVVFKETFSNLLDNDYFEGFDMTTDLTPPKSISNYSIPFLTDPNKIKVIDSVLKVLSYVPTTYSENQIKEMVEYFSMIYNSTDNLEVFYDNIANSTKISQDPYNSKYSHLILFLIGKFHSDIESCDDTGLEYCPPVKSEFNLKHEDIPKIINHYNKLKVYDEQDVDENSTTSEQSNQNNTKKKSKKVKKSKKYLDQIMSEKISKQLNEPMNFNIENTKISGIPNLSDGPPSKTLSDSVDRESIATRINSTPSAPYSPNFAGFAHSMSSDCNDQNYSNQDDYLNSPQNAYYYKATDYLSQELQPVEAFSSMSSKYAGYVGM